VTFGSFFGVGRGCRFDAEDSRGGFLSMVPVLYKYRHRVSLSYDDVISPPTSHSIVISTAGSTHTAESRSPPFATGYRGNGPFRHVWGCQGFFRYSSSFSILVQTGAYGMRVAPDIVPRIMITGDYFYELPEYLVPAARAGDKIDTGLSAVRSETSYCVWTNLTEHGGMQGNRILPST